MSHSYTIENRRFTCLSPHLIRMEFSPTGVFEDRPSLVAAAQKKSIPFRKITESDGKVVLDTGVITLHSRDHHKAFFPENLECHWFQDGIMQLWRPGDIDYGNLGGTVRCLDTFDRNMPLKGSHPAGMASPDENSNAWLVQELIDDGLPVFNALNRNSKWRELRAGIHKAMQFQPENMMVRTANRIRDQYRYGTGILSRSGYFFLNDSVSAVLDEDNFPIERNTPGTQDWYFFAYGRDYKQAMLDWKLLSGPSPLPPKNVFGIFFSRWPAYDEKEAKEIIARFKSEGFPLSVIVLDMEWHKEGWCNWDWDPKMYSNPKKFFSWCHRNNLMVTLNVHPLFLRDDDSHYKKYIQEAGTEHKAKPGGVVPGGTPNLKFTAVEVDICNPHEARTFFKVCHDEIVQQGMDFWWVDGTLGRISGSCDQLVTNKLYYENVQSPEKRGMVLSRYGGLGSHRYGVYFTGDTQSQWEVLEAQCEFNIRAGHLGMAYISHDIGGFAHPSSPLIDPILYTRWLQFGVFNPVIRFHSAPGSGSRKPWDYGPANLDMAKHWLRFRNSMIPFFYTAARKHHDTCIPIVRGLFFDFPQDDQAYRYDEFLCGDSLLVAPILTPTDQRRVYLPKGKWFNYATGELITGEKEFTVQPNLKTVPLYVRTGSILVRQPEDAEPISAHVKELLLEVFPGGSAKAELYEDDILSPRYLDGEFGRTEFLLKTQGRSLRLQAKPLRGKAFGKSRELTLVIALNKAPRAIRFNGKSISKNKIKWDPAQQRCTVSVGKFQVDKGFQAIIECE